MKRITFVISAMGCGGAERVLSYIANYFAETGYDVTLLILNPQPIFYPLDKRITVRITDCVTKETATLPRRILNFGGRLRWLRREILASRPDIVISVIDIVNVMTLMVLSNTKVPVVICEVTNPDEHKIRKVFLLLRRWFYPLAKALVIQTESIVPWTAVWLRPDQIRIFPNPLPTIVPESAEGASLKLPDAPGGTIVAVGRLSQAKGYDLLIEAFRRIADRNPGWILVILGEGELREELAGQINKAGLTDRVFMPGAVKNLADVLKTCTLYVLSSRYEGFPNALCEAMICGMPVISYDCPSGPRTIIRHEVDGLLVPPEDIDGLAAAMERLMHSPEERAALAARAVDITGRFNSDNVMKMWENLAREFAVPFNSRADF